MSVKSSLSLEATQVTGHEWTEACASLSNEDGEQELYMTPMEMQTLYARLKLYYEQGVWSFGEVPDDV